MNSFHGLRGRLILPLCATALTASQMRAALTVDYDFESVTDVNLGPVKNLAPAPAVDGIIVSPAKVGLTSGNVVAVGGINYSLGQSMVFTSADGDDAGNAGSVDTQLLVDTAGIANGVVMNRNYTAMAWVKWGSTVGDNMIFGTINPDNRLHLGSRNGNFHSGHWGDDIGPDQGISIPTGTGEWQHVAFVNEGNNQSVFKNGQLVMGPGATGASSLTDGNLIIGSAGNGGSFVGTVDEVKVFGDQAMTAAQIQAEMINGLPIYTLAAVTKTGLSNTGFTFQITDDPTSAAQTASITLSIDGNPVVPTSVTKVGTVTTVLYNVTGYEPGSSHTFELKAKDQTNKDIAATGSLSAPYLPPTLIGPEGSVGRWGMRELRPDTGIGDPGLAKAVGIAQAATAPVTDVLNVPVVNHSDPDAPGGKGNFNNDLPFLSDAPGIDDNNIVMVAKTKVVVPAAGRYTFAVRSDDGFGMRVKGARFISSTGAGSVDGSDSECLIHVGYTGDSNTRGVCDFPGAGTYDIEFLAFEGGGGGFWELAWAPGQWTEDRNTGSWTLVGTPTDPAVLAVPFTPKWNIPIPGPAGTDGKWGMRTYLNAASVDNLQQVWDFLRDNQDRTPATSESDTFDTEEDYLNHRNPDSGVSGVIGKDALVPGGQNNVDRVVVTAHGRIKVEKEADYTFNAHGDDGFFLRVTKSDGTKPTFKRVTGLGRFEMSNPNEMFYESGTGDTTTRGWLHLTPGEYDLEYIMWEGGGGFWFELSVAEGLFENDGDTPNWRPVGYHPSAGVTSGFERPGISDAGWTVTSTSNGRFELDPGAVPPEGEEVGTFDIAGAERALTADGTVTTWDVINFNDPGFGGPGSIGGDSPWPRDTAGVDDDRYAMGMTAQLIIPSAGDYYFGFQGDDGGYLEIEGQPWAEIIENATGASVITTGTGGVVEDRIVCNVGTGNSRTVARITLAAGTYTIRSLVFEGGGGSYYEIFASKGPFGEFYQSPLLAKGASGTISSPDGDGFALVGAAPAALLMTNVTATGNPVTGVSLTWGSTAGKTYTVQASTSLAAGGWIDVATGLASGGASTTYNVNVSGNPQLAGKTRLFFRAVEE